MELALVVPILMVLLGAIIQLGFIFAAQVGVINATREAARNAATTTPTQAQAEASVNGDFAYDRLLDTWLPKNVMAFDASGVEVDLAKTPHTQVCYTAYSDPAAIPAGTLNAIQVTVTTAYKHRLFVPLIANIFDAFDGDGSDGRLAIPVSETMRVENQEFPLGYGGDIPPGGVCYQ